MAALQYVQRIGEALRIENFGGAKLLLERVRDFAVVRKGEEEIQSDLFDAFHELLKCLSAKINTRIAGDVAWTCRVLHEGLNEKPTVSSLFLLELFTSKLEPVGDSSYGRKHYFDKVSAFAERAWSELDDSSAKIVFAEEFLNFPDARIPDKAVLHAVLLALFAPVSSSASTEALERAVGELIKLWERTFDCDVFDTAIVTSIVKLGRSKGGAEVFSKFMETLIVRLHGILCLPLTNDESGTGTEVSARSFPSYLSDALTMIFHDQHDGSFENKSYKAGRAFAHAANSATAYEFVLNSLASLMPYTYPSNKGAWKDHVDHFLAGFVNELVWLFEHDRLEIDLVVVVDTVTPLVINLVKDETHRSDETLRDIFLLRAIVPADAHSLKNDPLVKYLEIVETALDTDMVSAGYIGGMSMFIHSFPSVYLPFLHHYTNVHGEESCIGFIMTALSACVTSVSGDNQSKARGAMDCMVCLLQELSKIESVDETFQVELINEFVRRTWSILSGLPKNTKKGHDYQRILTTVALQKAYRALYANLANRSVAAAMKAFEHLLDKAVDEILPFAAKEVGKIFVAAASVIPEDTVGIAFAALEKHLGIDKSSEQRIYILRLLASVARASFPANSSLVNVLQSSLEIFASQPADERGFSIYKEAARVIRRCLESMSGLYYSYGTLNKEFANVMIGQPCIGSIGSFLRKSNEAGNNDPSIQQRAIESCMQTLANMLSGQANNVAVRKAAMILRALARAGALRQDSSLMQKVSEALEQIASRLGSNDTGKEGKLLVKAAAAHAGAGATTTQRQRYVFSLVHLRSASEVMALRNWTVVLSKVHSSAIPVPKVDEIATDPQLAMRAVLVRRRFDHLVAAEDMDARFPTVQAASTLMIEKMVYSPLAEVRKAATQSLCSVLHSIPRLYNDAIQKLVELFVSLTPSEESIPTTKGVIYFLLTSDSLGMWVERQEQRELILQKCLDEDSDKFRDLSSHSLRTAVDAIVVVVSILAADSLVKISPSLKDRILHLLRQAEPTVLQTRVYLLGLSWGLFAGDNNAIQNVPQSAFESKDASQRELAIYAGAQSAMLGSKIQYDAARWCSAISDSVSKASSGTNDEQGGPLALILRGWSQLIGRDALQAIMKNLITLKGGHAMEMLFMAFKSETEPQAITRGFYVNLVRALGEYDALSKHLRRMPGNGRPLAGKTPDCALVRNAVFLLSSAPSELWLKIKEAALAGEESSKDTEEKDTDEDKVSLSMTAAATVFVALAELVAIGERISEASHLMGELFTIALESSSLDVKEAWTTATGMVSFIAEESKPTRAILSDLVTKEIQKGVRTSNVTRIVKRISVLGEAVYGIPSQAAPFGEMLRSLLKDDCLAYAAVRQEIGRQIGLLSEKNMDIALGVLDAVLSSAIGDNSITHLYCVEIVAYCILRSLPIGNALPTSARRDQLVTALLGTNNTTRESAREADSAIAEARALARQALLEITKSTIVLAHNYGNFVSTVVSFVPQLKEWQQRKLALDVIAMSIMSVAPVLRSNQREDIKMAILQLFHDDSPETRQAATMTFSTLLRVHPILERKEAEMRLFEYLCEGGKNRSRERAHGIAALVLAHPYEIPEYIPTLIQRLSKMTKSFSSLIQHTLGEFRRTHQDTWTEEKRKFSDEDLDILSDVIAPPSYYA